MPILLKSNTLHLREAGAVHGEDVSHSVEHFFALMKAIARRLMASRGRKDDETPTTRAGLTAPKEWLSRGSILWIIKSEELKTMIPPHGKGIVGQEDVEELAAGRLSKSTWQVENQALLSNECRTIAHLQAAGSKHEAEGRPQREKILDMKREVRCAVELRL